jgi:hypothetical protein
MIFEMVGAQEKRQWNSLHASQWLQQQRIRGTERKSMGDLVARTQINQHGRS